MHQAGPEAAGWPDQEVNHPVFLCCGEDLFLPGREQSSHVAQLEDGGMMLFGAAGASRTLWAGSSRRGQVGRGHGHGSERSCCAAG